MIPAQVASTQAYVGRSLNGLGVSLDEVVWSDVFRDRAVRFVGTMSGPRKEVSGRRAFMFVSMLNRSFSRSFLFWFFEYCAWLEVSPTVVIVDEPYLAGEGRASVRLDRLRKVSLEVSRKVERVARNFPSQEIRVKSWRCLNRGVPEWLSTEVACAFERGERVRELFVEQTRTALRLGGDSRFLFQKARFVLAEIPLLAWEFYSKPTGALDFYPGRQAPFFPELEAGRLAAELPLLSALADEARPLVSCEVSLLNLESQMPKDPEYDVA